MVEYIDDIIFFWKNWEDKLKNFIGDDNKTHATMKFTAEWSNLTMKFLDVAVSIKNEIIDTDLFVKPTD